MPNKAAIPQSGRAIDLDKQRPEAIIDSAEPLDLARAVEALDAWTPRHLLVIDDVLANWVPDTIARPNDAEGLVNLESAIARILDSAAARAAGLRDLEAGSAADFAQRWRGFADTVRARHMTLEARAPERIRQLKHVSDIEASVIAGTFKQSDIQKQTGLSASRLSQVLTLMESNGMLERQSVGKERHLSIPQRVSPRTAPTAFQAAPHMARGASWFSQKAA